MSVKGPKRFVQVMAASTCWAPTAVSVSPATSSTASVGSVRVSSFCYLHWTSGSKTMRGVHLVQVPHHDMFRPCVSDINECRHYPGRLCGHKCENTPGSYKCSCTMGFKLAADSRNCDGKFKIWWREMELCVHSWNNSNPPRWLFGFEVRFTPCNSISIVSVWLVNLHQSYRQMFVILWENMSSSFQFVVILSRFSSGCVSFCPSIDSWVRAKPLLCKSGDKNSWENMNW